MDWRQRHSYFSLQQDYAVEQSNKENTQDQQKATGRWKLLIVLAVCAAPMLASYFTYYVIKPESRTNYGALLAPRAHPIPVMELATLDGKRAALDAYKGKWIMLQVDGGDCLEPCRKKL